MPASLTYPGVYVEEIPSGVRSITGVATSITAFVGRALKGTPNEPILINSFSDFQRTFGGLWAESALGYAVNDFYLNGGSQAIIVRLFHPHPQEKSNSKATITAYGIPDVIAGITTVIADAARLPIKGLIESAELTAIKASEITTKVDAAVEAEKDSLRKPIAEDIGGKIKGAVSQASVKTVGDATKAIDAAVAETNDRLAKEFDPLELEAANPGKWANNLGVRITYPDETAAEGLIKSQGLDKFGITKTDLFNLTIRNNDTGETEIFQNLTVTNSPRKISKVLENESKLLRVVEKDLSDKRPTKHAEKAEKAKKDNTIWDANSPSTFSGVLEPGKASDGDPLDDNDYTDELGDGTKGINSLNKADIFNLLCIPPDTLAGDTSSAVYQKAMKLCADRRAMLIVDAPRGWMSASDIIDNKRLDTLGLTGPEARNAALYFPRISPGGSDSFAPCGAIAGVMARTDSTRGIWKAPAGVDASLKSGLNLKLTDAENGMLNPLGINCLRNFPVYGSIVWGARTMRGADQVADEYKYIPVRRMALYIEESLFRGLKWVVFEPNDESLWAQIRLNVGAFMHNLFRQGAFQGNTTQKAYFVKCDKETTTQDDINKGIVNIVVGFAPLKPAEFVVIKIQQMAGDIQV